MLDYTKAVIQKIKSDFNNLVALFQFSTQIFDMLYLTYALIKGTGVLWVNLLLLGFSLAFFAFTVFVKLGKLEPTKQANKRVKQVFAWCKRIIKLYPIGLMTYTVYATTQSVDTLSVLLTALMIVGWVLGIVFELITYFLVSRFEFIAEGLKADFEGVSKVKNFFKRLKGEEIEEPLPPTKQRIWLDEKVAQTRAVRAQEKQERKAEAKRKKRQAKIDKKEAKRLPAQPPVALIEEQAPSKEKRGKKEE